MKRTTQLASRLENRHGATAVEFALVLPILLLILFGSMEFARLNEVSHAASFASFQACRQAIISGGNSTDATSAAQDVLNSLSISGATITITPSTITPETVAVTAVVSVNMNKAAWITPVFSANQIITRGCTLTCQDVVPTDVPLPTVIPVQVSVPPVSVPTSGTTTTTVTSH